MASTASITVALHDLFVRVLDIDLPSADTDLIENGLIDSLALVELLVEIEREFEIELLVSDLQIDNFRTLESIADFVHESSHRQSGTAAE